MFPTISESTRGKASTKKKIQVPLKCQASWSIGWFLWSFCIFRCYRYNLGSTISLRWNPSLIPPQDAVDHQPLWPIGPRDANATVNGDCNAKVAQNQALVSILPNPGHLTHGSFDTISQNNVVVFFWTRRGRCKMSTINRGSQLFWIVHWICFDTETRHKYYERLWFLILIDFSMFGL